MKRKQGRPRSSEIFVIKQVRITEQQDKKLKEMNKRTQVPISAIVRIALDHYFKNKKPADKDWEPMEDI